MNTRLTLGIAALALCGNAYAMDYAGGDYGGADLALVDGDTVSGVMTNLGAVTVDGTVSVLGSVEIYAARVLVDGALGAKGGGEPGGEGALFDASYGADGSGLGFGGGGGPGPCAHGGGGGGGGHAGAGGTGQYAFDEGKEGTPGATYGAAGFVAGTVGSGGGGGGGGCSGGGGTGGSGGGAIFVEASTIVVNGSVYAYGTDGAGGSSDGGGGGGGSGGSVVLVGSTSGAGLVAADGGAGGDAGPGSFQGPGGGGGGGYVSISGDTGTVESSAVGGPAGVNPDSSPAVPVTAGLDGIVSIEEGSSLAVRHEGDCPGPVRIEINGTPGANFALFAGDMEGSTPMPGALCGGVDLGIEASSGVLWKKFLPDRDGDGVISMEPDLPDFVCDMKWVAVDTSTCEVSSVQQFTSPIAPNPECSEYTELSDAFRNVGWGYDYARCDSGLAAGWYRFTGDAGTQMLDYAPGDYNCGTHAPGWIDGHPAFVGDTTRQTVCYDWSGDGDDCTWDNEVDVTNCGDFYVYNLVAPPVCSLAYCGM